MEKYEYLYNTNDSFKEYVDKYCNCLRHKGVTVEQALKCKTVQAYADYLTGDKNGEQRI